MDSVSYRFGDKSEAEIESDINSNIPLNTQKSRKSVWNQFQNFMSEKKYKLEDLTSPMELNIILKNWAANMKKQDGTDYKEGVVKHMWNTTAKIIQEMYITTWNIKIDPFNDVTFKTARQARDAARKLLQICPEKRTNSAEAVTEEEYTNILQVLDEDTPDGLQKKIFFIVSYELAWRGGEGVNCMTYFFKEETDNRKTAQGGGKKLAESKWLIANKSADFCPIRMYHKLMSKRGSNVKIDRMFLTPNPHWNLYKNSNWYKNSPVGINEMGKWMKNAAKNIGLDTKKRKISNHSLRSSVVSTLAKAGVGENQLMKITGHSNINSIKSYLQLDSEHHQKIVEKMRTTSTSVTTTNTEITNSTENEATVTDIEETGFLQNCSNVNFSNCTFNFNRK